MIAVVVLGEKGFPTVKQKIPVQAKLFQLFSFPFLVLESLSGIRVATRLGTYDFTSQGRMIQILLNPIQVNSRNSKVKIQKAQVNSIQFLFFWAAGGGGRIF